MPPAPSADRELDHGGCPVVGRLDRVRTIDALRDRVRLTSQGGRGCEIPLDTTFLNETE